MLCAIQGPFRLEQAFVWGGRQMESRKKLALGLGLVTAAPDDIDWEDEIRTALEQRASMSPDALTGLEANLRFASQENMLTRIFGRLTAWQNWIFQRPNAVGEKGALEGLRQRRKSAVRHEPAFKTQRTKSFLKVLCSKVPGGLCLQPKFDPTVALISGDIHVRYQLQRKNSQQRQFV